LNTADSVISHVLFDLGLAREVNPFLKGMAGEPAFFIFKGAGIIACVLSMWYIYRRFPGVARACASSFCIFYAVLVLWNAHYFLPA
jgi:hypothetical protein